MHGVNAWAAIVVGATLLLAVCDSGFPGQPLFSSLAFLEQALLFFLVAAGAAVDARRRIIPNAVCGGILVLHVAFICAYAALGARGALSGLADAAAGGLVLGGGLLAFTLAYESFTASGPALGGGDIKLVSALGFALGLGRGTLVLAFACVLFTLYAEAIAVRARIRGGNLSRFYPFGPALAAGLYLVLLAC